jgi:hypothetical protein
MDVDALIKQFQSMPRDEHYAALVRSVRGEKARRDFSPEGFASFYWCIWQRPVPQHGLKWVEDLFRGHEEQRGVLLEASRGFTKSTTLITFALFLLGHSPWGSELIIQASDLAGHNTSKLMASIIETNIGWNGYDKAKNIPIGAFPHVVPDKEAGWGAQGYFVKDVRADYGEWMQKTSADHLKDPSFVACGVMSNLPVGLHPSLMLLFDDIHERMNSSSDLERESVKANVLENILPTMRRSGKKPFFGIAYTPWHEEDTYGHLKQHGDMIYTSTPAAYKAELGTGFEMDGEWWLPAWEEGYPPEEILKDRNKLSKSAFYRAYMCDLVRAKDIVFKYHSYSHEKIDWTWPIVGGVDYASVIIPTRQRQGGRSHFALAYALKPPHGGAVIGGGILEQCTQAQAEIYLNSKQGVYPGWLHTVVEGDGKGEEFITLCQRNPNLKIVPMKTRGTKKSERLYEGLSTPLELGRVRISDENTPFLNALRKFLEEFPNLSEHDPGWDAADATFWALRGVPDVLMTPTTEGDSLIPGKKEHKMLFAFGRM